MGTYIGYGKKARMAYGFDDIAITPGRVTINPNEVDTSWDLGDFSFEIPIIASAMDCAVDSSVAAEMSDYGALAVLNLEGLHVRYEDPRDVLDEIASASPEEVTEVLQRIYSQPILDSLIEMRIREIHENGNGRQGIAAVSATPQNAERLSDIATDAGADIFVIQSTVSTVDHISSEYECFDLESFCSRMGFAGVPVIVGNCVTYRVALDLMEAGADAVLCGVGPGEACTTRGVLGLGVPQVTATCDVAYARDKFLKKTGKYVPVITDGGMSKGAHVCKAFASGADAVMMGSPFARAEEAPGLGYHWGQATPHAELPRGARVHVGTTASLKEILFGPSPRNDGSLNLVGALRTCMGSVGAENIRQMQEADVVLAPSIVSEGKSYQLGQGIGMGA